MYGLFIFDGQVFIGESANIQEALLRHESETDFQSRHLRPTGFTFEPCAAELRKPKADELIARFHPVLQTGAALTETWSPSNGPMVSEVGLGGQELETYADHQEFPVHERVKRPKVSRPFYFMRTQGAALAAMFVASAVVIFYLGIPIGKNIQKRVNGAGGKPPARISITQPPASGRAGIGLRPQNVSSIDTAGGLANQSAEPTPAKPGVHGSASTPNGAVRFAAKSASAADVAGVQALLEPGKTSPHLSKKWSVQISAAPAKDIADTLVQRLKANGYDGYVIRAEVKGQTYYRVRVGQFAAREEAESLRQSLARQEGYRDAFLTGD
ncbi:MAG: SPOR domain-containing protein [Candidatus Binatia bacterium]